MSKIIRAVTAILLLTASSSAYSQLKLGTNPTNIQKSSVLELESANQGLLLSRISDTSTINALNPPDGMVIYFTPAKQIMVRSAGYWQTLTQAGALRLANLGDVLLTGPVNGQILKFNGTKWVNFTPNYLTTIDTTDIANFYLKVRSLLSAGPGITYNNTTGVIGNAGVLSLNGNTGALTMDTTYISNFYLKVRGLLSSTVPITYTNGKVGITQANTSTDGYLSSTDWNTFNNKPSSSRIINTTAPLQGGGDLSANRTLSITDAAADAVTKGASTYTANDFNAAAGVISIDYANGQTANTTTKGFLTAADWNTFNNKAGAFTSGNLTETGSGILTITGGTGAVLGAGTSVQVKQSNTSTNGFLSNTDWNTFNNKLSTIDTTNITNFSTKIRSLFSGTAPITYSNGLIGITQSSSTTNGYLSSADWNTFNSKGGGSVTSVSVTTANGVSGVVANPTTTPAITLTLGAITPTSVAATGTMSGSNLSGTNTGDITIGTANGLSLAGQALSLAAAGTSTTGALTSTDWNTFNNKLSTIDTASITNFSTKVRSLFSGSAPITYSNGSIGITLATTSANGYLSSADWNTFNNKANGVNYLPLTGGTLTGALYGTTASFTASNPLSLNGVQAGAITDSILTITGGVVKKLPYATVTSGSSWSLTGNAGTSPGTNFIGTTDNQNVVFKRNGIQAGLLSSAGTNTSWGVAALNSATTGTSNTATGYNALAANITGVANVATGYATLLTNTTGGNNTALGNSALQNNTTGSLNTATGAGGTLMSNTVGSNNSAYGYAALNSNLAGSNGVAIGYNSQYYANNTATPWTNYNTSIGYQSLTGSGTAANNTGNYNIAIGYQSMMANTVGTQNTATGTWSLLANTTGNNNTANGYSSLLFNTSGVNNTATGSTSLNNNSNGNYNTATGANTLFYNTSGSGNTATGIQSLYYNTTGGYNTVSGYSSLVNNTTGANNTASGSQALSSNVAGSNAVAIGYNSQFYANNTATPWTNSNTSIGYQSLQGSLTAANNTGVGNTALGYQSMVNTSTGSNNTALGLSAMVANTVGYGNTATGVSALGTNASGNYNVATGQNALASNIAGIQNTALGTNALSSNTGSNNVAIGFNSLANSVSVSSNTAVGTSSLVANTSGSGNTALGLSALGSNTTGIGNTGIGYNAGGTDGTIATPNNLTNATAVGYYAQVTASNSVVLGGTGTYAANVGIGTTAPAYKLDVNGTGNFTGNLTGTTAVFSGNVTANSDIRLKKNIHTLPTVSESLRNINAVEFDRRDVDLHQVGFIAQNVQKYFPALVTVAKDSVHTLSLNYQAMTSPLLKGWQEHDAVIKTQQTEIDALKKELDALKQTIEELKKK